MKREILLSIISICSILYPHVMRYSRFGFVIQIIDRDSGNLVINPFMRVTN